VYIDITDIEELLMHSPDVSAITGALKQTFRDHEFRDVTAKEY
jgi:hypothetical protein